MIWAARQSTGNACCSCAFVLPGKRRPTIRSVVELRSYSKQYGSVRQRLRELLKDDDLLTRILAAEALSVAGVFPEEAVPVLTGFMDHVRSEGLVNDYVVLLGICLLALSHYGTKAVRAGLSVWMYIYSQDNVRLKVGAVGVVSRFAKVSKANRIILRNLCKSKVPDVREKARSIVRSREFIAYMRGEQD